MSNTKRARPETKITGWRYFRVEQLKADVRLLSPFYRAILTRSFSDAARCRYGFLHPVPSPKCECGWRITTDLDTLIAYIARLHLAPPVAADLTLAGVALARCQVEGHAIRAAEGIRSGHPRLDPRGSRRYDPPRTYRAARYRITGPLFLNREASPYAAALESMFGCDIAPSAALSTHSWLRALREQAA